MATTGKTRTTSRRPEGASAPSRPQVSRDESLVRQGMADWDAGREEMLERLALEVKEGRYERSGVEIAEAIIAERMADREPAE
jgi:hypothetical protein